MKVLLIIAKNWRHWMAVVFAPLSLSLSCVFCNSLQTIAKPQSDWCLPEKLKGGPGKPQSDWCLPEKLKVGPGLIAF